MVKVEKTQANRFDIQLSGNPSAAEIKAALDELREKSKGIQNGQMLYVVSEFVFPPWSSAAVDMPGFPALFRLIRRFDRAAVLADEEWTRKIIEFEGPTLGLEVRAFELHERVKAEAWLSS